MRSAAAAPVTQGPAMPMAVPAFEVYALQDNTRAAVAIRFRSQMHIDYNRRLTRMLAEPLGVGRDAKGTENTVLRLYSS